MVNARPQCIDFWPSLLSQNRKLLEFVHTKVDFAGNLTKDTDCLASLGDTDLDITGTAPQSPVKYGNSVRVAQILSLQKQAKPVESRLDINRAYFIVERPTRVGLLLFVGICRELDRTRGGESRHCRGSIGYGHYEREKSRVGKRVSG